MSDAKVPEGPDDRPKVRIELRYGQDMMNTARISVPRGSELRIKIPIDPLEDWPISIDTGAGADG